MPVEILARRSQSRAALLRQSPVAGGEGPVAIVGAGPSLARAIDELENFTGDIWAINSAFPILHRHGIDAAFFTIDPNEGAAKCARKARRRILIDCVHSLALTGKAKIELFPLAGLIQASTTATAAPDVALGAGHSNIVYYGCEGNFEWDGETHTGQSISRHNEMHVVCDGNIFQTNVQMFIQTLALSTIIRGEPKYFQERSGGLLRAMVNDPDYDIVRATPEVAAQITYPEQDNAVHHVC